MARIVLQDGPVQGIKLELFIFDPFPLAAPGKAALMEVDRAAEFAPVKNAPGEQPALTAPGWGGRGVEGRLGATKPWDSLDASLAALELRPPLAAAPLCLATPSRDCRVGQ